jgi:acetylglutamate kinase
VFVGEVEKVNPALIDKAINDKYIPVIAPVGVDSLGQSYNINADYAAGSVAASLNAEKLFLLTDIDGVLDKEGKLISRVDQASAKRMIADGTISGGMIPKIECCMEAIANGVSSAHIVNGTLLHALLLEIFTDKGVGTMFVEGENL